MTYTPDLLFGISMILAAAIFFGEMIGSGEVFHRDGVKRVTLLVMVVLGLIAGVAGLLLAFGVVTGNTKGVIGAGTISQILAGAFAVGMLAGAFFVRTNCFLGGALLFGSAVGMLLCLGFNRYSAVAIILAAIAGTSALATEHGPHEQRRPGPA